MFKDKLIIIITLIMIIYNMSINIHVRRARRTCTRVEGVSYCNFIIVAILADPEIVDNECFRCTL